MLIPNEDLEQHAPVSVETRYRLAVRRWLTEKWSMVTPPTRCWVSATLRSGSAPMSSALTESTDLLRVTLDRLRLHQAAAHALDWIVSNAVPVVAGVIGLLRQRLRAQQQADAQHHRRAAQNAGSTKRCGRRGRATVAQEASPRRHACTNGLRPRAGRAILLVVTARSKAGCRDAGAATAHDSPPACAARPQPCARSGYNRLAALRSASRMRSALGGSR